MLIPRSDIVMSVGHTLDIYLSTSNMIVKVHLCMWEDSMWNLTSDICVPFTYLYLYSKQLKRTSNPLFILLYHLIGLSCQEFQKDRSEYKFLLWKSSKLILHSQHFTTAFVFRSFPISTQHTTEKLLKIWNVSFKSKCSGYARYSRTTLKHCFVQIRNFA